MFLFDWMKIYDASQGNVREVVRIFPDACQQANTG